MPADTIAIFIYNGYCMFTRQGIKCQLMKMLSRAYKIFIQVPVYFCIAVFMGSRKYHPAFFTGYFYGYVYAGIFIRVNEIHDATGLHTAITFKRG